MTRTIRFIALLVIAACLQAPAEERRDSKKRDERIAELSEKLARRLRNANPSEESVFLHERAAELLHRVKEARGGEEYRFDRLSRAADSLLEASERILDSAKPAKENDDDDQREAARELERCYFRVKQADYFARQAREAEEKAYLLHIRRIYQQARSAYDLKDYRKARLLADAAEETVDALERLAQARIRIPEPPRLP